LAAAQRAELAAHAPEDLHGEVGFLEQPRSAQLGLRDGLLGTRLERLLALRERRLDLAEDRVDAGPEVLALGRAAAEGLAHLPGGPVLRAQPLPDADRLGRGPRHADDPLAELEGRRLDLLGEQDLLLLREGRDVRDVAEVGDERAALAGALALALRVEPLRAHAHPVDRAGLAHRLLVGVDAELGLRPARAADRKSGGEGK